MSTGRSSLRALAATGAAVLLAAALIPGGASVVDRLGSEWAPVSAAPAEAATAPGAVPRDGWASCGPVPFLVSVSAAPPSMRAQLLEEARAGMRELAELTGVRFEFVGRSDVSPSLAWKDSNVRTGGYRHAPVLLGWVPPSGTDMLASDQWAAASRILDGGGRTVSAVVAFNANALDVLEPGFGPGMTRGAVLLHELGHVAGLPHGDDGLMRPVLGADAPAVFSPLERTLLASSSACR